jgi:sulfofructose kinase
MPGLNFLKMSTMANFLESEVLSLGIATVDNIVVVESYPDKDERVIAMENIRSIGGPAAVAAITMARLGIKTSLSTVVGSDENGDLIVEKLKSEGVDTSLIERSSAPTSVSTIVISKSQASRAIMVKPERVAPNCPFDIDNAPSHLQWIHVDHFGAEVMKNWGIKRGQGLKLSIDIGYPIADLSPSDWDLYVPSEKITQNIATAQKDKNWVVISHGERGSAYSDGANEGNVPAISTDVVSTLGAGDVFHGALVATRVWGLDIRESVEFASAVAGLSCRGIDGFSAVPSREEVDQFLKNKENKEMAAR